MINSIYFLYSPLYGLYSRYHISDWLSFNPDTSSRSYKMEKGQELAMVEGALQYFTMLLHVRTFLGEFIFTMLLHVRTFLGEYIFTMLLHVRTFLGEYIFTMLLHVRTFLGEYIFTGFFGRNSVTKRYFVLFKLFRSV